jgi:predicted alpha/beta superfamily hydrolase
MLLTMSIGPMLSRYGVFEGTPVPAFLPTSSFCQTAVCSPVLGNTYPYDLAGEWQASRRLDAERIEAPVPGPSARLSEGLYACAVLSFLRTMVLGPLSPVSLGQHFLGFSRSSAGFSPHAWAFALLAVAALSTSIRAATPFTLGNTEVRPLPQSANGRSYILYVSLPSSYATSPSRRYPVVYATDGYWDFALLAMNVGNEQVDGSMPESIVVGIAYAGANPDLGTLREWDLTPGVDTSFDPSGLQSGHAQEFLGVIANEFIPFVDGSYRSDPAFRILTGNSFGGLFALYSAFERPGLFQAVIASSPSVWWRSEYLVGRAQAYAAGGASLNTRVWVSYGTEDSPTIVGGALDFARQLGRSPISGLTFAIRDVEGERHSSTKPEAFNRGLRFACANIAPIPPGPLKPGFGSRATMVNLSTRGLVGGGQGVLIGGFVVSGIQPKRLLVRAAGPSLRGFGITNPLSDPVLTVYDANQNAVASNDNWGSAPDVAGLVAAASQCGAFPFDITGRDSAALVTLDPGAYTVVVGSADGTTGVALVEVYELLP